MSPDLSATNQIKELLRREKALATFGTFAFRQTRLEAVLDEAAKVCAECLDVPFSKICMYRSSEQDLLVVAGHGWQDGVVVYAISGADHSSPQGLAFETGEPQICPNIAVSNTYTLPAFYTDHGIISTVDVLVAADEGAPFGVLEVDSQSNDAFDEHDINFLTGFANVLAEAVATAARAQILRQTIADMEKLIEEKETLSQELKHRVRNSLHLVYGLLTAELESDHDESSVRAFRSIALRVMGLAEVFDHLLGTGMSRVINFGDYVSALCLNLPELYKEDDIKLAYVVEPVRISLDAATSLGIIITELVNNAYLHAFPRGIGEISVALGVEASRMLLSISDNGIGFVETQTQRRGMVIVRRLVGQIGGTLSLRSDHGSGWTIDLPIDLMAGEASPH
jgi:two-component sensor histidine kinase